MIKKPGFLSNNWGWTVNEFSFERKAVDENLRVVHGYAYVCRDPQGEPIFDKGFNTTMDPSELERAFYEYMLTSRVIDLEHDKQPIGRVVGGMVMTRSIQEAFGITGMPEGVMLSVLVDDPNVWARVKNGDLKGFSVGGRASKREL